MKKFKLLLAGSVLAIACMSALLANINEKKEETKSLRSVPKMDRWETKNEEFRKLYPRQYDSWKKTRNSDDIGDMLKEYPELVVLWAGYGFAKDYNAPRGHFYAIEDNRNTLRTGGPVDAKSGPMPTACWTCKGPDVPRLINEVGEEEFFSGKWAKYGSDIINPIGCVDCHNPETMELQVNRPHLKRALASNPDLINMEDATQQDMRSLVCAQCHVEYYFKKVKTAAGKKAAIVTLPWAKGTSVDDMEKYYDEINFKDWTHKISKTPMLKAQHPGYEMWMTGAHGRNGVSCADCHMPYKNEGGIKYTDHNIGNPLDNMDNSCMTCHRVSEASLLDNIQRKKERKTELHKDAMEVIAAAHLEAGKAWELGATKEEMAPVLMDIRHAQWRWDYAVASHPAFFHAPEETLRVLATAVKLGGEARLKLSKILAKYGAIDYKVPVYSTKEEAQKVTNLPFKKLIDQKMKFRNGLLKEWKKEAEEKGIYNPKSTEMVKDKTSYGQ
ncbi:MAG: ammonia-forming cytochrome c nitrite reductase [Campylobacterales bacterium]|nr:ammonia-forming cytochrome c nitrite reductase [Campylobacterales bacterium]NQY21476.1 ammonia-forming cytochrome c nitrite reductase [Campylobacteraceae bacterium]NQY52428.1 ammonia-forming cytochrome c nitrite reductase [Campylobacteraceae bacterium]